MERNGPTQPAGDSSGTWEDAPRQNSQRHDTLPSWFRLSAKLAVMVLLLSLPALALRDPRFEVSKGASAKYSMLFMLLGIVALPMWVPQVGQLVLTFTVALPVCYSGIWIAFGLFRAYHNVYFLQISIIVATLIMFGGGELIGLPRAITGVWLSLYSVCICNFLMTPALAQMLAVVVTAALAVAAVLVTAVYSVVFPEYCTDMVWRGHHEGLEHLLHMAHHTLNSKPPRLMQRGMASEASRYASGGSARRALLVLSDQRPSAAAPDDPPKPHVIIDASPSEGDTNDDLAAPSAQGAYASLAGGPLGWRRQGARVVLTPLQKAERSYQRMLVAMTAGARAGVGARAELVLGFCGANTRLVIPWFPLLPSKGCRPDPAELAKLRTEASATALGLYKLQAGLQHTDAESRVVLRLVESSGGASWETLKRHLLGALQEVVDAFPMDYYPPPRCLSSNHIATLEGQVAELNATLLSLANDSGNGSGSADTAAGGRGDKPTLTSASTRLQATLMLQQLRDTAADLRRLHNAAAAAMEGLSRAAYGFLGFPCCRPQAAGRESE